MGRPPKIDDLLDGGERRGDRIVALIRNGNYAETAARTCGISAPTFYRWMELGDTDAPTRYREFREAVLDARAHAESAIVLSINQAVRGGAPIAEEAVVVDGKPVLGPDGRPLFNRRFSRPDARLGLEFLARTQPRRFGRREQLAITGEDGGPVRVEDEAATRLAASLDAFAERVGGWRGLDPPTVIDGTATEVDREPLRELGTGEDDDG